MRHIPTRFERALNVLRSVLVLYCSKCGNEVNPNHKFCSKCGTPVTVAVVPQTVKTAAQSADSEAYISCEPEETASLNEELQSDSGVYVSRAYTYSVRSCDENKDLQEDGDICETEPLYQSDIGETELLYQNNIGESDINGDITETEVLNQPEKSESYVTDSTDESEPPLQNAPYSNAYTIPQNNATSYGGTDYKNNANFQSNYVNNRPSDTRKKAPANKAIKSGAIIIIIFICVAVIGTAAYILFGNSRKSNDEMTKALESRNAYAVNSLYNEAFDNEKLKSEYDNTIRIFLTEAVYRMKDLRYNASDIADLGEEIVYSDLKSEWGDLIYSENGACISLSINSDENNALWVKLKDIIISKTHYCQGVVFLNAGSVESAVTSFKSVIRDDCYYHDADDGLEKCVDLYLEETFKEAEDLASNGDFDGAVMTIEGRRASFETMGLTSADTSAKLDDEKTKCADIYIEKTLNKAENYAFSNDCDSALELYDSVLRSIKNAGIESEHIDDLLTTTKTTCAEHFANNADNCLSNGDVDGAIDNMEKALRFLPDEQSYKEKLESYPLYQPKFLYNEYECLSINESDEYYSNLEFGRYSVMSNDGQDMSNCITWSNYREGEGYNASFTVRYNLDCNYDILSGTFFLTQQSKNTDQSGYFEIYGDGTELYYSGNMTKGVLPEYFEISVSDVSCLEIVIYADCGPTFGISELTALKSLPEQ